MKQLNWYQIFGNVHTIPEGSTVTPTDDVQILLHCANIWDKSYTTIGEVIADDDTLFLTLIDNNAIDYLVRSTTFASSIVASESAMQYIGASDYASETLLSDSTWNTAIDSSSYKDYVVNAKVPKMTSATTPEGTVISSGSDYRAAYTAFDEKLDNSTFWMSKSGMPVYIGYRFVRPIFVSKVEVITLSDTPGPRTSMLQGSTDGVNWDDLGAFVNCSSNNTKYSLGYYNTSDYNDYYRLYITASNRSGGDIAVIKELQFYGREIGGVQSWLKAGGITNKKYTTVSEVLSDLTTLATLMASSDAIDYLVTAKGWAKSISVPVMTSNNAPYGQCIASSEYSSSYSAWKAFDAVDNTMHLTTTGASLSNYYLGYTFNKPVNVNKAVFYADSYVDSYYYNVAVYGGNDISDLHKLSSDVQIKSAYTSQGTEYTAEFTNANYYSIYVLKVESSNAPSTHTSGTVALEVHSLQFYTASITADSNAMADIGMNNYAANTLLADETWKSAIANSTYVESVMNVKVPVMTDDTHPYGACSSTALQSGNAYYAFDKNASTNIVFSSRTGRIIYKFVETVDIYAMRVTPRAGLNPAHSMLKTCTIDNSSDGNTWNNISTIVVADSITEQTFVLPKTTDMYFSLYATGDIWVSGINNSGVIDLQFYGRKDI